MRQTDIWYLESYIVWHDHTYSISMTYYWKKKLCIHEISHNIENGFQFCWSRSSEYYAQLALLSCWQLEQIICHQYLRRVTLLYLHCNNYISLFWVNKLILINSFWKGYFAYQWLLSWLCQLFHHLWFVWPSQFPVIISNIYFYDFFLVEYVIQHKGVQVNIELNEC